MRMHGTILLAILICGLALSGCSTSGSGGGEPPGPANVRIANAQIGGVAFDVCSSNEVILENSRFGQITDYAEVTSGTVDLEQIVAGSTCDNVINDVFGGAASITVSENTDNTAVLLASGDDGFVLRDDNSPTPADRARVRLVNASEDSLSLTVTEQGGAILFALVRYDTPADYDYAELLAGTYDLIVTPQAADSTPLTLDGVEFQAGSVYTLFAVGRVDGEGEPLELVISEDAQPGTE